MNNFISKTALLTHQRVFRLSQALNPTTAREFCLVCSVTQTHAHHQSLRIRIEFSFLFVLFFTEKRGLLSVNILWGSVPHFLYSYQIDQLFNFLRIILKTSPWQKERRQLSTVKQSATQQPQLTNGSLMEMICKEKRAMIAHQQLWELDQ